jgi:hypothetical protein
MDEIFINVVFYSWESSLVLGPLFGFLLTRLLKRADRRLRIVTYTCLAALLLAGFVVLVLPLSFRGIVIDAVIGAAGYAAYCALAFAVRTNKSLGQPAFLVMSVPMAIGMFVGTIGVVGVALIFGDVIPKREVYVNSRYSCRYNSFGNATTRSGGVTLSVFYHPPYATAFEWSRFSRSFDDSEYDSEAVACSSDPANGAKLLITAPTVNGLPERIVLPFN